MQILCQAKHISGFKCAADDDKIDIRSIVGFHAGIGAEEYGRLGMILDQQIPDHGQNPFP